MPLNGTYLANTDCMWRAPFDASNLLDVSVASSRVALQPPPISPFPVVEHQYTEVCNASARANFAAQQLTTVVGDGNDDMDDDVCDG
jgi:hypothetical protein